MKTVWDLETVNEALAGFGPVMTQFSQVRAEDNLVRITLWIPEKGRHYAQILLWETEGYYGSFLNGKALCRVEKVAERLCAFYVGDTMLARAQFVALEYVELPIRGEVPLFPITIDEPLEPWVVERPPSH